MSETGLVQLAGILVLGVAAQWAAWRLRLPSILLLLPGALAAGVVVLGIRRHWLPDHLQSPVAVSVFTAIDAPVIRPGCSLVSLVRRVPRAV